MSSSSTIHSSSTSCKDSWQHCEGFESQLRICLPSTTTIEKKPRIQVIDEKPDPATLTDFEIERNFNVDANFDDSEDGPPDIFWKHNTLPTVGNDMFNGLTPKEQQQRGNPAIEGMSLMDQMIKEGLEAKRMSEKKKIEAHRKQSKKKEAYASFKKGFLSNLNKKSLDDDNDDVPMPTFQSKSVDNRKHDELPILRPNPSLSSSVRNPLYLAEVHEEIDSLTKGMNHMLFDNSSQWMTPSLMEKISKNPKFLTAMSNPTFTSMLHAMMQNPKTTTETLKQNQPEMLQLMREFCELLGDHFSILGQEQEDLNSRKSMTPSSTTITSPRIPSSKTYTKPSTISQPLSNQEEEVDDQQIHAILQDKTLAKLLMDPKMKYIIQECSTVPGKLKSYMQHPQYGPRLRKMIDVGLFKIH